METDADPREFLLDIEYDGPKPLVLTATYCVCSDTEGWCKRVTQRYVLRLKHDPDSGIVLSRNKRSRRARRAGSGRSDMAERFMRRDRDGDGRVSRDEAPRGILPRFHHIDENHDGFIDREEIERHLERVKRR